MAKGAYIGINNVARKVKKIYVGVDGVARKVKKAYIGIGGVARLWFSSGLAYHGTATALSPGRFSMGAATAGNYALFAGGASKSGSAATVTQNTVEAYNNYLTKSTPSALSAKSYPTGGSIGTYALFVGVNSKVDSYNSSLTRQTLSGSVYFQYGSSTRVGNRVLFGGGGAVCDYDENDEYFVTSYDNYAFDSSLTRGTFMLEHSREYSAAATAGNYALFAGGNGWIIDEDYGNYRDDLDSVEVFNSSLTKVNNRTLKSRASRLAGATLGTYAIFAGGSTIHNNVRCFNSSLTATDLAGLTGNRRDLVATTLGNFAIFSGGGATVDVYDSSLTKVSIDNLSVARNNLSAATVGTYALFAGGNTSNTNYYTTYSTVDVYTI